MGNDRNQRIAFCTVPHVGGIYSVYQKLRNCLGERGWEVLGVQVGDETPRWDYRPDLADGGVVQVAPQAADLKAAASEFVRWIEAERIKIVIPMSCPAALASIPHLPADRKIVTRCISTNIQAYRLAASCLDRLSAIVVTTPRQQDEIARRFQPPATLFRRIPNAVDTSTFAVGDRQPRRGEQAISILYVGRLLQLSKNVFALPQICKQLIARKVRFKLTVVGNGADGEMLNRRLAAYREQGLVEMLGPVSQAKLVSIFENADCLLLPSEEEGFPNAVIEAMACGVVPVVSRIRGVTDWIIEDQASGILCTWNKPDTFAAAIERLYLSPHLCAQMGAAARKLVGDRFSLESFAGNWHRVFSEVVAQPPRAEAPLPWDAFSPPPALRKSRYAWLPRRARNSIRSWLDAVGIPTR